jgi:UDP-glucose 4-epimerase
MVKKKIIILGSSSTIGQMFFSHAQSMGHEVFGATSKDCDLKDPDSIVRFFEDKKEGPYSIIFFSVINKLVRNDYLSFIDNTKMVQNFIDFSPKEKISNIIFFSSVDVYGLKPQLPITEQTVPNPDTYYGLAKLACEKIFCMPDQVNCPVTIFRIPGIYGGINNAGAIGTLVNKVLNSEPIFLTNRGNTKRDYVHVDDVCRVLDLIIESPYPGNLNLATGNSHSTAEIVEIIQRLIGEKIVVNFDLSQNGRDFDLVFNIDLFKNLFPSFRFLNLEEGILKCIKNERRY